MRLDERVREFRRPRGRSWIEIECARNADVARIQSPSRERMGAGTLAEALASLHQIHAAMNPNVDMALAWWVHPDSPSQSSS